MPTRDLTSRGRLGGDPGPASSGPNDSPKIWNQSSFASFYLAIPVATG